jgi:hypothetical protein
MMSTLLSQNLLDTFKSVRTRPIFVMRLDVRPLLIVGATPGAVRRVGVVPGGSFEGERLSGAVLEGGKAERMAAQTAKIEAGRCRPRRE